MLSEMSGNNTELNKQIGDNYWCEVKRRILTGGANDKTMFFEIRLTIMIDNNDGPVVMDLSHDCIVPYDDMRTNIKRALYNEMLGNPNRTPMSATEVAERMADLSRQIGSAFGRLQAEFVQPVLARIIWILKKQGRINMPVLNGREAKVVSVSP